MLSHPLIFRCLRGSTTLAGVALAASLALASASCGTGGEESRGGMSGLPGAGLGPFRRLDTDELSGRLALRRMALVESGMVLRGAGPQPVMFYAAADVPPAPVPPLPDAGADADGGADLDAGIDLDAGAEGDAGLGDAGISDPLAGFLPRRILRSNPGDGPAYIGGEVVLEAREAWEGDAVYDPWAVRLADGRVRLYYAAAGGIGLAEADSSAGSFTRVGAGPVLTGLRRPTLAARPDRAPGFFLYAERDGAIVVAESADGLTFGAPEVVDLGFMANDAGMPQIAVGSPGAGLQVPTLDPPRVVLFFESRRADGSRTLGLAASRDGRSFERATLPSFGMGLAEGFPAPDFVDARTTLLYFTVAATTEMRPSRALTVAVSPGTLRFD
jgi:hypothetical protein